MNRTDIATEVKKFIEEYGTEEGATDETEVDLDDLATDLQTFVEGLEDEDEDDDTDNAPKKADA